MFNVDTAELRRYESHLKAFHSRALPFATKETLNTMAFQAQLDSKRTIGVDMINRNTWTKRSIQVRQARTLNIRRQSSAFGSTEGYMETQEFGGRTKKRGKNQTVIPTSFAAGQEGSKPRTKLPTKAKKIQNIQLAKKIKSGKFKSHRQRAFLTALLAVREKERFVFVAGGNSGRSSSGIYRVWGKDKRKGRFTNVKMRMVYSLRRNPSPIKKLPWMNPAADYVGKRMPRYYEEALKFQLKRQGVQLKLL